MKKKISIILIVLVFFVGAFIPSYKYFNNKKVNTIETYLNNKYGDKCSIAYDGSKKEFTLSYIDKGYSREELKDLFEKNDLALKQWSVIVNKYKSKCKEIRHDIKNKYKKDVNVSYVCEDENKEILIYVRNGEVEETYF